MEDIARHLRDALLEDLDYAVTTLAKIGPRLKEHFADDAFPVATYPAILHERMEKFRKLAVEDDVSIANVLSFFETSGAFKNVYDQWP
ncbi:hypothetical protein [Rhizobium sp. RAF56]|uniref:hypothetical protein n=1 Tax=Rhizobium sp. RAF56 TaxID=3233062 RepID=UPI003F993D4B